MAESDLNDALIQFERVEANMKKLETLWNDIRKLVPDGIVFGDIPEYNTKCRAFASVQAQMPKIGEISLKIIFPTLNEIAQNRLDIQDLGEPLASIQFEESLNEPEELLNEYIFHFHKKRRELVRDAVSEIIQHIDDLLHTIELSINPNDPESKNMGGSHWADLRDSFNKLNTLLGSGSKRPPRWDLMIRHIGFAMLHDFHDIKRMDWPEIKNGIQDFLYDTSDPLPVAINDLAELVAAKPKGSVTGKLNWNNLSPDEFERLIFKLISESTGYENASWLTTTNAPDRGRDLSTERVFSDSLSGTFRYRVIIQCKHWLTKSVSPADITSLRDQMKLWEPPPVDIHIVATSGRFTTDAVALVEKLNSSDTNMKIEMWPESHLETLLATHPHLIAAFNLRE